MKDPWHEETFLNLKKGENPAINDKLIALIKNIVRDYVALYQNPNEHRVAALSHKLLDALYTPHQISQALDSLEDTEDKIASIAQIKSVLRVKYGLSADLAPSPSKDIKNKLDSEIERFNNQKNHFLKQTNQSAYERFVMRYVKEVYPEVVLSDLGVDTWGRLALCDFYDADCDFKRCIELGKKRAMPQK